MALGHAGEGEGLLQLVLDLPAFVVRHASIIGVTYDNGCHGASLTVRDPDHLCVSFDLQQQRPRAAGMGETATFCGGLLRGGNRARKKHPGTLAAPSLASRN